MENLANRRPTLNRPRLLFFRQGFRCHHQEAQRHRLPGLSGVSADVSAREIRQIADDAGITICATHEPGDLIRQSPHEVMERLKTLGTPHTAYPYPSGVDFNDAASIKAMVSDLDAAGAVLR